jgi:putative zinc finger/helix-turn-helix YgiT family protein
MYKCYCDNCDTRVPSHIKKTEETLPIRGDSVTLPCMVRICDICGNECYDEEFETELLRNAFDIYRQRHNIIFPEEISKIRKMYGLSQRGLAALLGWGDVTIHRYESGSIADEAHNQLLQLLKYPENMLRILRSNGNRLPASARKKLHAKLEEILGDLELIDKPQKQAPRAGKHKPPEKPGFSKTGGRRNKTPDKKKRVTVY